MGAEKNYNNNNWGNRTQHSKTKNTQILLSVAGIKKKLNATKIKPTSERE